MGFLGGSEGENLPAMQETQVFDPWVRKIPWRREWQPTSVFLPEEFHGQKSLASCSLSGRKELDMPELLTHTKLIPVRNWDQMVIKYPIAGQNIKKRYLSIFLTQVF